MALSQGAFSRLASAAVSGLVSTAAQTFAGVKTFANGLIASAAVTINSYLLVTGAPPGASLTDGQSAYLGSYNNNIGSAALWLAVTPGTTNYAVAVSTSGGLGTPVGTTLAGTPAIVMGRNGSGAADVCTKIGTNTADGSVSASAKLISVRTGIGGTEVENFYVAKGALWCGVDATFAGALQCASLRGASWGGYHSAAQMTITAGWLLGAGASALTVNHGAPWSAADARVSWLLRLQNGPTLATDTRFMVDGVGRLQQYGTNSTASPGAATIDKPIGKSAVAAGAASVVITNALVSASSHVMITQHARDATCKELIAVPASGSFTVSGTGAATADLPFSWEVKAIL